MKVLMLLGIVPTVFVYLSSNQSFRQSSVRAFLRSSRV